MVCALATVLRNFVRWFVLTFFVWLMRQTFDSVVRPWMDRPLTFLRIKSAAASEAAKAKFVDFRDRYNESLNIRPAMEVV